MCVISIFQKKQKTKKQKTKKNKKQKKQKKQKNKWKQTTIKNNFFIKLKIK
jgi:hypothetical protein